MKHYGDITKLDGYDLPIVDVVCGGSPCQDLSVAGRREGLDGERSGLFMEQIRIIKEMREHDRATGRADEHIRPRYMVWENVPGAFSSNGGKDFQTVLTEIVRIIEPDAPDVPLPDKKRGGWRKSGCLYDELAHWSIAWRVHDAQFWGATQYVDGRVYFRGTPQRRKRIALVADFAGLSAPEILFERKGLCWHSQKSREARERTSERTEGSTGESDESDGVKAYSLAALKSNCMKSANPHSGCYQTGIARTIDTAIPAVQEPGGLAVLDSSVFCLQVAGMTSQNAKGSNVNRDISFTLNALDRHGIAVLNDQGGSQMTVTHNITSTLRSQEHGHQPIIREDL